MTGGALADLLFDSAISGIWPVLLLPLVAARLCRDAVRRLPDANADWRIAAILAALPGTILLVLIAAAMARSILHLHPDDWRHFVQHHFIWIAAPFLIAPATIKAIKRRCALASLLRLAHAPEPRLGAAAYRIGIPCRQLPTGEVECFVAGMLRPMAYVSAGALGALGESELDAALRHERAHLTAGDSAAFAILAFLNDLVPGDDQAIAAYRQARERLADERATADGDRLSLAAALVVFSRAQARAVPSMASAASGTWRISALLDCDQPQARQAYAPTSLKAGVALLPWPAVQTGLAYLFCSST